MKINLAKPMIDSILDVLFSMWMVNFDSHGRIFLNILEYGIRLSCAGVATTMIGKKWLWSWEIVFRTTLYASTSRILEEAWHANCINLWPAPLNRLCDTIWYRAHKGAEEPAWLGHLVLMRINYTKLRCTTSLAG